MINDIVFKVLFSAMTAVGAALAFYELWNNPMKAHWVRILAVFIVALALFNLYALWVYV